MEPDQGVHRGTGPIPRISKPSLPLASNNNLRATAAMVNRREPAKGSSLPRPSRSHRRSVLPHSLFGDHVDLSSRDRTSQSQPVKPVKPPRTVRAVKSQYQMRSSMQTVTDRSILETTPPSSDTTGPFFEDGNENATQHSSINKKPRPRMSLSERTIETLSAISPSPSPGRPRRESLVSYDGLMGPPPRPTSRARLSNTVTPTRSKSRSPVKQAFRPPGRAESPSKPQPLPTISSANSTVPLPRVAPRASGSMRISQRSVSNTAVVNADQGAQSPPKPYTAQTMRVKSSRHDLSQTPSIGKAYTSIFSPPPLPPENRVLALNGLKAASSSSQPLPKRQTLFTSSTSSGGQKANVMPAVKTTVKTPRLPPQVSNNNQKKDSVKSSAALRSAIAQAKAARKGTASTMSSSAGGSSALTFGGRSVSQQDNETVSNQGLLRSRICSALTSGHLNIAAMKLGSIPEQVIKMYEPDESSVNWADIVDLLKFNAADNEITDLDDDIFPDLSLEEVANSDDKSSPFGGIESLDLRNNQLHSLPLGLRRLERLTVLNLSGNKLTNACLDIVWQIPGVQELNLARNQLSGSIQIPNGSISKLHVLNLSENNIQSLIIDEDASSPLITLNVSKNQLADLPWEILASSFEQLVQLNASTNLLATLILNPLVLETSFANLRELDLSDNSIEVIEPDLRLPRLQMFAVNKNRLESLPASISSWESLITLQAAENNLSEIPLGLTSLTKSVKAVDLSMNSIKSLDPGIARMQSLTALQLTGNPLRERKFLSMDTESIKMALSTRLEPDEGVEGGLCDDDKPVASVDAEYLYAPVNGVLDLSSKGLTEEVDLSTINLEGPVHTLRLSNNDMSAFPRGLVLHPSINGTLKSLDLSHNPLATTTFLAAELHLPVLESLYIVSTSLDSLDPLLKWLKAPRLRELNISCHRLAGQLPQIRNWFPKCTTLLATDNWFSSIQVDAVRGLEVLDIRNNEIESLPSTLGLLGNHPGAAATGSKREPGRLRCFECGGNRFRVPRIGVIEKGTEAVLKDLRRMIPEAEIPDDWRDEI